MIPIKETTVNSAESIAGLLVGTFTLFYDNLFDHKLTGNLFQYVLDVTHL